MTASASFEVVNYKEAEMEEDGGKFPRVSRYTVSRKPLGLEV